jgi:hypothetical protein
MPRSFLNTAGLPIGLRNNNPGNIRPGDNWRGMIGQNGGFVVFENIGWGIRAIGKDLITKYNNGYNTIAKIITRYAPPSENNTANYISLVSGYTGISPNTTLNMDLTTLRLLIRAIMNVECGISYSRMITDAEINEGIQLIGNSDIAAVAMTGTGALVLAFAAWLFYKNVIKPGY